VRRSDDYSRWLFWQILSGGIVATISLGLTYPLEVAHSRLTADVISPRQFSGVVDCLSTIYSQVFTLMLLFNDQSKTTGRNKGAILWIWYNCNWTICAPGNLYDRL